MIVTITTSTVTTVTAIAAMGLTAVVSIAVLVSLLALLTTKELAVVGHFDAHRRVSRFINVGIVPLIIAFAIIVLVAIL